MKKVMLLAAVVIFSACSSNQQKNKARDTAAADGNAVANTTDTATTSKEADMVSSLCFLNTKGKDSTSVELVIKNDKVTGIMNWLPYQKDSRKGKLEGVKRGDTILATWSFMQEGMTDTLLVDFKLQDDNLVQRPLKLNKQTGREQTDAKADYSIKYHPYAVVKK